MWWNVHRKKPGRECSQKLPEGLSEIRSAGDFPFLHCHYCTWTSYNDSYQLLLPGGTHFLLCHYQDSEGTVSPSFQWGQTLPIGVGQSVCPTGPAEYWVQGWVDSVWTSERWDVCCGFMEESLPLTIAEFPEDPHSLPGQCGEAVTSGTAPISLCEGRTRSWWHDLILWTKLCIQLPDLFLNFSITWTKNFQFVSLNQVLSYS